MAKKIKNSECLWYNGEEGTYHLLDFDPNGLTKRQIKAKVLKDFDNRGIDKEDIDKMLETVYLIDVDDLKRVF